MASKGVRVLVILVHVGWDRVWAVSWEVLSPVQRLSSRWRSELLISLAYVSVSECYSAYSLILHLLVRQSSTLAYVWVGMLFRWCSNMMERQMFPSSVLLIWRALPPREG